MEATEFHRYTLHNKTVLSPDDQELHELCTLAGLPLSTSVFHIVVDLLHMNVAPAAIERMLKSMVNAQRPQTADKAEPNALLTPPSNKWQHKH